MKYHLLFRIQEQKIDGIIKNFGLFVNRNQKRKPINKIHWAYEIQHRYERLIKKEDQLFDSAKKGMYVLFKWGKFM